MAKDGKKTGYAKARRSTSLYFLLWTVFSVFALLIVILMGIMQAVTLRSVYREEIRSKLADDGRIIREELFLYHGSSYDGFIRSLSVKYDLNIYVLKADGSILFPAYEGDPELAPDFKERVKKLVKNLGKSKNPVLYEDDSVDEYVYGVGMTYEGEQVYLYVSQSLELMNKVLSHAGFRVVIMGVFMLVLSFAVSSAISGAVTRPITEITEKARQLAWGDFTVDFSGSAYMEEMTELADTLNYARDEISKSDAMQKELIANVSHDFKTPLTMIKAYAEMLVDFHGEDKIKREQSAQIIIDEADRLTSLVSDVLDLSKIRSGIQALSLEPFDICAYCREILTRFDYLSETQGYQFETEIAQGLYTVADKQKIGQVLYNLIGNAVNYTGKNKKVRVVLKKEKGAIYFAVMDTGKGIKEEELSEIWDRYYRSGQSHKRPIKGTGLGLSIVKTILERHCFEYGVDSIVGVGSTFYAYFPLSGEETSEE